MVSKFSSTQFDLPQAIAKQILAWGKENIKDEDLYIDPEDPSYGRETNIHVTIKYGLHTNSFEDVVDVIKDVQPFNITLSSITKFESDDYDVLKIDVESPGLHKLNRLISSSLDVTDTYSEYRPHVTIAYVKKGVADKYLDNDTFAGTEIMLDAVTFSDKHHNKYTHFLKNKSVAKLAKHKDLLLAYSLVLAAKIDELLDKSSLSDGDKTRVKDLSARLDKPAKYAGYLLRYWEEKDIVELCNEFEKKFQKFENKDINSYAIEDLRDMLKLSGKSRTEKKTEGAEKLGEDSKYILYHIKNAEASKLYGKGTKWCIAADKDNMFDYYNKNFNIYFLMPKSGMDNEKIAFIIGSGIGAHELLASGDNIETYNAEDKVILNDNIPDDLLKLTSLSDPVAKFKDTLIDNGDGTYSSDGDVEILLNLLDKNNKIGIKFKEVKGNFMCSDMSLTSLEGCPEKVGGYFDCIYNNLTNLIGGPKEVSGNYNCARNNLTSLEGAPEKVDGNFNCNMNLLTSLEGCDNTKVKLNFWCESNNLTSLKGAPKEVGKHFSCKDNTKEFTEEEVKAVCNVKGYIYV